MIVDGVDGSDNDDCYDDDNDDCDDGNLNQTINTLIVGYPV